MKSVIEQEIEWCETHMGESGNGIEFEKSFIAGLKQALFLEKAVEQLSPDDSLPLLYKALCVIEYITSHEDIEKESTWLIYEAAHVAIGHCKADHQDWITKVESMYDQLELRGWL